MFGFFSLPPVRSIKSNDVSCDVKRLNTYKKRGWTSLSSDCWRTLIIGHLKMHVIQEKRSDWISADRGHVPGPITSVLLGLCVHVTRDAEWNVKLERLPRPSTWIMAVILDSFQQNGHTECRQYTEVNPHYSLNFGLISPCKPSVNKKRENVLNWVF